jgi:hypothetical protein
MPGISYIHPLDQPLGQRRLLSELRNALQSQHFDALYLAVAAVSLGPLLRLDKELKEWKSKGKRIEAVFGVDIGATTFEALSYSLHLFDAVYLSRISGIKFHPKIYMFKGPGKALVFFGSHNLTVPGTETNFEASVVVDYTLPGEAAQFGQAFKGWTDLLAQQATQTVIPLTSATLAEFKAAGLVISEKQLGSTIEGAKGTKKTIGQGALPKSSLKKVPPSSLPKGAIAKLGPVLTTGKPAASSTPIPTAAVSADTLVMQVVPHHNGEILLSKIAVDQNPGFFGWPFGGWTTPKKASNPKYPQRTPDPIVDIAVFGAGTTPKLQLVGYALNTVYYSKKSEIRVTCSDLVGVAPPFSIMVMAAAPSGSGRDYDIQIFRPDSADYQAWLAVCNQSMPGGGGESRKFGWL